MEAKLLAAAILVLMFALPSRAVAENSSSDHKSAVLCDQTDYVAYRTCVHEAKRHKRQLLVPSHLAANLTLNANDTTPTGVNTTLHCQRLNFDCRIACDNDTNCESRCPVCPLNVSQLAADQVDYRTVVVESPNGSEQRFQVSWSALCIMHYFLLYLESLIIPTPRIPLSHQGSHPSRPQHHHHHPADQHPQQHQSHSNSHQCDHQQREQHQSARQSNRRRRRRRLRPRPDGRRHRLLSGRPAAHLSHLVGRPALPQSARSPLRRHDLQGARHARARATPVQPGR